MQRLYRPGKSFRVLVYAEFNHLVHACYDGQIMCDKYERAVFKAFKQRAEKVARRFSVKAGSWFIEKQNGGRRCECEGDEQPLTLTA